MTVVDQIKVLDRKIIRTDERRAKNIDMILFKEVFYYDVPDKVVKTLHRLKRVDSYNQEALSIEDKVKMMLEGAQKKWRKENVEDC